MFVEEKAAGEVQTVEQANRKLKLSEAIRVGAKLRPQGKGSLFINGKSCAFGAAAEALGMPYDEGADFSSLRWRIPWLEDLRIELSDRSIDIWRMNDVSGMTREQIADTLEAQGY